MTNPIATLQSRSTNGSTTLTTSASTTLTSGTEQSRSTKLNPNAKLRSLSFVICALVFICHLSFVICHCSFAQDDKLASLTKQIIEAKDNAGLFGPFEELKRYYFKDNKYSEFVDFLKSLGQKKETTAPFIDYLIALARLEQLKYLEDKQLWEEYFNQGGNYKDELISAGQKAVSNTTKDNPLHVYSALVLWEFHKHRQDGLAEQSLMDLMGFVSEYANFAGDIVPIKKVADSLLDGGKKQRARELYRLYVSKVINSDIRDEQLRANASQFYNEGALELSEALYDAYIERIKALPAEQAVPLLTGIAREFAYKDEGRHDVFYAEKIFKKIAEIDGKAFDEGLTYLRAYNLEKAKEYKEALGVYLDLVQSFPEAAYADEANYKIGIIYVYVLRDIKNGKAFFERLAAKDAVSPQVISSLYQLGVLSQWEEVFDKAGEYYEKLFEKAKDGFRDTVTLTKARLAEIDEGKPMEYNLKTFLGVSLKEEYSMFDMTKVQVRVSPARVKREAEANINSSAQPQESGCMQVSMQYLWSGHTGKAIPSADEPSFNTSYSSEGTKEIGLVVVSPSGVIDRGIDLIDVK